MYVLMTNRIHVSVLMFYVITDFNHDLKYAHCSERLPANGATVDNPSWTFSPWYTCPTARQFINKAFIYVSHARKKTLK
jgi:hypothetical protein